MDTPDTEEPPPTPAQRIFGAVMEGLFIIVFGWIALLIALASGELDWMGTFPKFWISTLGSAALGALVCWLAGYPIMGWLFVGFVIPGALVGIWWERQS